MSKSAPKGLLPIGGGFAMSASCYGSSQPNLKLNGLAVNRAQQIEQDQWGHPGNWYLRFRGGN